MAASDELNFHFDVDGNDFTSAGEASVKTKKLMRQLGLSPELTRRVAIAMYEGEINMVIHANGGTADIYIGEDMLRVVLADTGPGIQDVAAAMQEGFSTAPDNIRALGFGAGMGLPNMKRYSDDMAIDSVVGKGTTIELRFKLN